MKHNRIHQRVLAFLLSSAMVFSMVQMAGISAFASERSGVTAYYNGSGLFTDSGYTLPASENDRASVTQIVIKDSTVG